MQINYNEQNRVFKIDTEHTSYCIGIVDEENFVGHIYYGRKLSDDNLVYLMRTMEPPFVPSKNNRDRNSFLDTFPMEYTGHGLGDFREGTLMVRTAGGHSGVSLSYVSHRIYDGKEELAGLPATFGTADTCRTLELTCEDKLLGLQVILSYSIFADNDAIARSVRVVNGGKEALYLTKVLSACIDMDNEEYEMITLPGSWARERIIQTRPVLKGKQGVSSVRGESSHQEHPFMAWKRKTTTEEAGDIYAMNFVYSGNFMAQIEGDQSGSMRALMGIHPQDFCWKLEPGDAFQAPEVICVYSAEGIGGMSRTFHDLYRRHLIRGEYKDKKRPILINNWEATYFDFDTDKLLAIAREASALGIEMLVMDDGWFGCRNDDNSSLGDWKVNEEKLKGGLKYLVDEVNKLGMKFGIWLEPEMISPDSDLYRAHPDWAIAIPGREGTLSRHQYVLDLTREDVLEHTWESISKVLQSANIEYVKWDMNRQLTDIGSAILPAERMGELYHRYVLGVYELQRRLTEQFPNVLLENCSGGGARFDPGMLYYAPQGWLSDDSDAVERLKIQYGASMCYPISSMGAHVSVAPNHQIYRNTPLHTRANVACFGTFGYELDLNKLTEEETQEVKEQIAFMKKYRHILQFGTFYRLNSPFEGNEAAWMAVSEDKKTAVVGWYRILNDVNGRYTRLRLEGLHPEYAYRNERSGLVHYGDELMYAGLITTDDTAGQTAAEAVHSADFESRIYVLEAVEA